MSQTILSNNGWGLKYPLLGVVIKCAAMVLTMKSTELIFRVASSKYIIEKRQYVPNYLHINVKKFKLEDVLTKPATEASEAQFLGADLDERIRIKSSQVHRW